MDVDKLRTTAYHPSCNGVVERFHATVNASKSRAINDDQSSWDLAIPYVLAAYRSSTHESTGMTPNFVATGREVHAPVDLVYTPPETERPTYYASHADELIDQRRRAHTLVREQLGVAAVRNKRNYDMRVRPQRYTVGQWVHYFNPRKIQGRQDKWRRKFQGPFLIVKTIWTVNVMLQRSKRSQLFCTHVDKIKLYVADEMPQSWLQQNATLPVHGDSAAAAEPTHSELVDEVDASNLATGPVTPGMRTSPLVTPDGDRVVSNRKRRKKVGRQDMQPKVSRQNDHGTDVNLAVNGFPLANEKSPRPRRTIVLPARYRNA